MDDRRKRALLAYLQSVGCVSLDDLDETNPMVASTPYSLIREALDEVRALLENPLESRMRHWMGEADQIKLLDSKSEARWVPLQTLQYSNFRKFIFIYSRTILYQSPLDAWQVCVRLSSGDDRLQAYHVQSLVDKADGKYFRCNRDATESVELFNCPDNWLKKRNPTGQIQLDQYAQMTKHPHVRPIRPEVKPLHDFILQNYL